MDGLLDEPRVGAPRTVSDAQVEEVVARTLEETPHGETHWSRRSMARAVGLSADTIGRIWQAFRYAAGCAKGGGRGVFALNAVGRMRGCGWTG
jgi:hypothetical protein